MEFKDFAKVKAHEAKKEETAKAKVEEIKEVKEEE